MSWWDTAGREGRTEVGDATARDKAGPVPWLRRPPRCGKPLRGNRLRFHAAPAAPAAPDVDPAERHFLPGAARRLLPLRRATRLPSGTRRTPSDHAAPIRRRPRPTPSVSPRLAAAGRVALGLGVLVALQGIGTWIADSARLPVPGSVVGMVLLTAAIELGLLPAALVREAADLLVRHLALLFVPGGAALLLYLDVVRGAWLAVTLAAAASLVLVLLVVGVVVQRLERRA